MTPPPPNAGATTAGRLRPSPAPRVPRRVSGPARRHGAGVPATRAGRAPSRARRPSLGPALLRLPDAKVLDRLLRGRAWILLIAAALIGIVFMQVSLLKLNSGISRAVTATDTLERQNSQLRASLSAMDGEARIQQAAQSVGLMQPPAGDVTYLDARQADAARAVQLLRAPNTQRAAELTQAWRTYAATAPQGLAALVHPTTGAAAAAAPAAAAASATSATSTPTPTPTPTPQQTPTQPQQQAAAAAVQQTPQQPVAAPAAAPQQQAAAPATAAPPSAAGAAAAPQGAG